MKKYISFFLLSITSIITYAATSFTEQTLTPFFPGATPRLVSIDVNIHGQAIATWYESSNQWVGNGDALIATFYDLNSGWGAPQLALTNTSGGLGVGGTFYMIPAIADSGDAAITFFTGTGINNTFYRTEYDSATNTWSAPIFLDQVNGFDTRGAQTFANNINNTFLTFMRFRFFHAIRTNGEANEQGSINDDGQYFVWTQERNTEITNFGYANGNAGPLSANESYRGSYNTSVNNNGNVICVYYVANSITNLQSIRATVYTPGTGWSSAVQIGPEFEINNRKNILASLNNNDEALLIATTDSNPSDSNFGIFFSARLTDLQNNTWEVIPNTGPNDLYINIEQMTLGLGDNGSGITFFNRLDVNDPGIDSTEYRIFTSTGSFPNQWGSFFTLYSNMFLSKTSELSDGVGPYGFAYNSAGNRFAVITNNLQTTTVLNPNLFIINNLMRRNIIVNPLLNVLGVGQDQPQNFTVQVYNTDYVAQRENSVQLSWEPPHIVSFETLTGYLVFHNQVLIATLPSTQLFFDIHNIDINESNEFRVEATFNGREASPTIITLTP